MANLPKEPEAFAEQVLKMLARRHPELTLELSGPAELRVDGRRIDLENLRRLVAQAGDRGTDVVEEYLEQMLGGEAAEAEILPYEFARRIIMPRIHHISIFERLAEEQVAHVPFVNDTAIVFVTDLPHCTVSVTVEQMVRWRTTPDALEEIARRNLEECSREIDLRVLQTDNGGRAVVFAERDGYDAARLLLTDLYSNLAPELGGDFLVATPARDRFVAISPDPEPFVDKVHQRVEREYRRLPYPITTDFFYVTLDGVAGTRAA